MFIARNSLPAPHVPAGHGHRARAYRCWTPWFPRSRRCATTPAAGGLPDGIHHSRTA